ncbi:hypothetical protein GCM10010497_03420 [Streptomyces cinereoruber]|uniref:Uncharacterized protein n=1 Tax=Streptomyces cinereoruber TaxID=67260 RepID=A0AAV4KFL5_9ACTN|nr:hypothetical protein GCM10010497_03420 [Streptomyces cinereoruber]
MSWGSWRLVEDPGLLSLLQPPPTGPTGAGSGLRERWLPGDVLVGTCRTPCGYRRTGTGRGPGGFPGLAGRGGSSDSTGTHRSPSVTRFPGTPPIPGESNRKSEGLVRWIRGRRSAGPVGRPDPKIPEIAFDSGGFS